MSCAADDDDDVHYHNVAADDAAAVAVDLVVGVSRYHRLLHHYQSKLHK